MPPFSGNKGKKWNNATQGIQGQLTKRSGADTVDISTSIADEPIGPLVNAPKQNETAQIPTPGMGEVVQVLADGTSAIAVGDPLKTNATGRAVKATRAGAFVTTVTYIIGYAEEALTAADKQISVRWFPQEGSWS